MPILHARALSLAIRFELHEHPEHVVQELIEEVGEDATVFPYSIRTYVEVDGEQLGVISTAEIQADATSIPRIRFDVASGLRGVGGITSGVRASIERTIDRLTAFPFVEVASPFDELEPEPPEPPPGLTVWERLMADD